MGLLNYLAPEREKRNALADALRRKSMADNAPVNALGAPGGLLAMPRPEKPGSALGGLLAASSVVPGIGDFTGPMADAHMYATDPSSRTPGNYAMSLAGLLPFVPSMAGITAFHGSPHLFDNFDMSKIGTGEGAQAYGHGLYFAESPDVAKDYQRAVTTQRLGLGKIADKPMTELSKAEQGALIELKLAGGDAAKAIDSLKKRGPDYAQIVAERLPILEEIAAGNKTAELAKGALYTVDIPDEAVAKMLDWDAPLSEQPEAVQRALMNLPNAHKLKPEMTGAQLLESGHLVPGKVNDPAKAAKRLKKLGIPGVRYLDERSRNAALAPYWNVVRESDGVTVRQAISKPGQLPDGFRLDGPVDERTRNFVVFDDKLPKILKRE